MSETNKPDTRILTSDEVAEIEARYKVAKRAFQPYKEVSDSLADIPALCQTLRAAWANEARLAKEVVDLRSRAPVAATVNDGVATRALRDIASQRLRSEIEPIDGEVSGDFEGAYDTMINVARDALAVIPSVTVPVGTGEQRCPHDVIVGLACHYCPNTIATTSTTPVDGERVILISAAIRAAAGDIVGLEPLRVDRVEEILSRHFGKGDTAAPLDALSRATKLCRSGLGGATVELIFRELPDAQAVHKWLVNSATAPAAPSPAEPPTFRSTKEAMEWAQRNDVPAVIPVTSDGERCAWTLDDSMDGDLWETGCGETFQFTDGGPAENHFLFCYKCSKRINAGKYSDHDNGEVK